MKIFVTIFGLLITTLFANDQGSWKISLNKSTVLISSESNELLNIKKIKSELTLLGGKVVYSSGNVIH